MDAILMYLFYKKGFSLLREWIWIWIWLRIKSGRGVPGYE